MTITQSHDVMDEEDVATQAVYSPWHSPLNLDPNRSSSSKLTIVRVQDSSPFGSPVSSISSISLTEPPSSPVLHHRRSHRRPVSTSAITGQDPSARLSFAFSSFAPSPPPPTTTTTRQSASSPSSSPRLRPSSPSFTRRLSGSGSFASKPNLSADQLVELARQSSSPRYITPSAPSTPGSAGPVAGPQTAAPTFTALPVDVYLPFVDRPQEVSVLLSSAPTVKLFSLLAQTFSAKPDEPSVSPIFSDASDFPPNPPTWSFATLRLWLTTVDRDSAPDALWVRSARRCILAHSELIWERMKGALGVPPELELDDDWDAWDSDNEQAIVDSPSNPPLIGTFDIDDTEDVTTPHAKSPPADPIISQSGNLALSVSPSPSPPPSSPPSYLSIEPLFATSCPQSTTPSGNPPPLSLPSTQSDPGAGLQDISEDQEDDDDAPNEAANAKKLAEEKDREDREQQVHGLRISTSPLPSSPLVPIVPFSPVHAYRTPSPSVPSSPLFSKRLSRTSSHGSVSSLGAPRTSSSAGMYGYTHHYGSDAGGDSGSERAYDPVGDRVPGNPLFPSNFARLALGPTLSANNPSLRSSRPPPAPAYSRFARFGGRPPSWAEGWDPVKQEYAVTVASGSSVGIGGGE
ncbi:hypothetical protein SERLA73DRAFT_161743 [Serpula lacrymans var. lacrymans S7.3]|uniref:Uncharacterized protein n=2 Tax=Serpula lacrymans var. lacrymans TaxID=341189 RepID=F8Q558_SERL3|nr:uncharacterized protein SERLADRAFT_416831 [Serpula lacrymans var. lacrymans S7.9]EGN96685.1 hypothetical protein SERLA73DRAFT_161743 [Serpula lacrymans var. lacrymans S7.3]EGO22303.1 hypothetical protein SERLADRAFT_416831 [Serpula lacrymans var. lacrymans S7.9]